MIRRPEFITFTGIDERTDLKAASALATEYPIEWGVLFSTNNQDARFPSRQGVTEILGIEGMKSAHLCGKYSRQAQAGATETLPLEAFDRVQINGFNVDQSHFHSLETRFGVKVIHQVRGEGFDPECGTLQLFDCSGGEGILPKDIPPMPGSGKIVGYAGGIGPQTVLDYLLRIHGTDPFWIDMEGCVRTNGWFDLDKVHQVCKLVYDK